MYFQVKTFYQKWEKKGYKKFPVIALFEALTWTEVEAKVAEKIESAEFEKDTAILSITPFRLSDILFNEDSELADKWFKAKITFEEEGRGGKTKKAANYIMVFAADIEDARKQIDTELHKWVISTEIEAIQETKIRDIYRHKTKEALEKVADSKKG